MRCKTKHLARSCKTTGCAPGFFADIERVTVLPFSLNWQSAYDKVKEQYLQELNLESCCIHLVISPFRIFDIAPWLRSCVTVWAELYEGWLALTSNKYHDNLLILMLLNQCLWLTMLRTTDHWISFFA